MPITLLRFYTRFAKPFHNELKIGRVLVRQHLAAMFKGIVRIDAEDLLPLGARIVDPEDTSERGTLLRPADSPENEMLLRPAAQGDTNPDRLLRPVDDQSRP